MANNPMRAMVLTWTDVDKLIDALMPMLKVAGSFDAMIMITRGGVIPGGLIAEAIDLRHMLTAAVDFPSTESAGMLAWPSFLQFPSSDLLQGRRTLIVDDVWGSGRTSTAVRERVKHSGGQPWTCVLHFNPYRTLFNETRPDFYADVTDRYVIYPWETDRGLRGYRQWDPMLEPET
jgi:uncharacterized protein